MQGLASSIREKGFSQTQVTDIVRHAGASRRTFYRCFSDKDACFVALAEYLYSAARAEIEASVNTASPWRDQVRQAVEAFLAILAVDPVLANELNIGLPLLGARGIRVSRASVDGYVEMLTRLTATPSWIQAGAKPLDPNLAVMLLTGLEGALERAVERNETVEDLRVLITEVFTRCLSPEDPLLGS